MPVRSRKQSRVNNMNRLDYYLPPVKTSKALSVYGSTTKPTVKQTAISENATEDISSDDTPPKPTCPVEYKILAAHRFPNGRGWENIDLQDANGEKHTISARQLWNDIYEQKVQCYLQDEQGVSWLKAEWEYYKSRDGCAANLTDKLGEALHLRGEASSQDLVDICPSELRRIAEEEQEYLKRKERYEKTRELRKAIDAEISKIREQEMDILKKIKMRRHGSDSVMFPELTAIWARPWEKSELNALNRKIDRLERKYDKVFFGI